MAGVGVEFAMTGNWTGKVEYNYVGFGSRVYDLGLVVPRSANVEPELHLIKVGLNYRLWPSAQSPALVTKAPKSAGPDTSDDWSIHGQTTVASTDLRELPLALSGGLQPAGP